ncbi:MAG: DMT family transporter [bacterium]
MASDPPDNIPLGASLIIATVLAMAFADAVIKYISADFPLWQIFTLRSLAAVSLLLAIALFARTDLRPRSLKWSLLRAFLLALMYIAIYAAAPVLALSVIAASLYTGPIFVALLSAWWAGEGVGARRWSAVALGFAGVLAIVRPAVDAFSPYALIPVAAGFLYALAAIITRAKCRREQPLALAVMLNFALLATGLLATGALFALRPLLGDGDAYPFLLGEWILMGSREWGIIALLAALIVLIGIGLAKAYQTAPPTIIATCDYAYLPFAALWGFVFFGEIPDTPAVIGIALITFAGVLVLKCSRRD